MKLLTQDIFKNQHEKYKSAALDSDGNAWVITGDIDYFYITEDDQLTWNWPILGDFIDDGYDISNWKTSKINRING